MLVYRCNLITTAVATFCLQQRTTALPAPQRLTASSVCVQVPGASRAELPAVKWTARYGLVILGRCAQWVAAMPTLLCVPKYACRGSCACTAVCLGRALRRPGLIDAAEAIIEDVVSVLVLNILLIMEDSIADAAHWHASVPHLQPAAAGCLRWVRVARMIGRQQRCSLVVHAVAVIFRQCSLVRTEGMAYRAAGRRLRLQKAWSDSSACGMLGALRMWLSQASHRRRHCALNSFDLVHSRRLWGAAVGLLTH